MTVRIKLFLIFSIPKGLLSNFLNLQVKRQSFNLSGPCRLSMLFVSQAVVLLALYIAVSIKALADNTLFSVADWGAMNALRLTDTSASNSEPFHAAVQCRINSIY